MSLRGAKRRGNLPEGNHFKSHARYFCTCVEKRSTQAKEWALSLAITWFQKRSVRRVAGALHIRAKVPYGHRTPKLRFRFSAAHRRHKKIRQPKRLSYFLWCRWPDSNRHGIATGGFWVHYVCQFHHTGISDIWYYTINRPENQVLF